MGVRFVRMHLAGGLLGVTVDLEQDMTSMVVA